MTDLPNRPKQSNFETTLATPIDNSTTSVVLNDGPDYASGGETTMFTILNPKGVEHITATGWSGGTLSGVTRGVVGYSGGASTARAHGAGIKVVLGNPWQLYDDINTALDSKVNVAGDTMTGAIAFSGTDHHGLGLISLTTAERDALSPPNGAVIYNETDNEANIYQGGAWSAISSGSTQPDSSTTVAGKVETATSAETQAGTDSGGTGANLLALPSDIAANVQNSQHSFAADAEASDTYAITLAPAPSAYATGQRFIFTANTANTGAATLNVNSLGAKTIKKFHDQDLEDNDIESGSVVEVVYDGTNFQLQTPAATSMSAANAATLTGAGDADALHTHDTLSMVSNLGNSTRSTSDSSGTQNIAHGLGRTPKWIHFAACQNGAVSNSSVGYVDDDQDNYCITQEETGSGSGSAKCIYVASSSDSWSGVVTAVDSTNITITWTKGASGLNILFTWMAMA